ncbi:MAG: choline-sulfatase [Rhizobiaceae bacterium]
MTKLPNILLLQVDQQAASTLSAYGGTVAKTPNIDRLMARSAIFDNAYTNFPVCAPSRFSMMSGQLASQIEGYDNAAEFRASVPTMAHYLRYLDYQTSLCGKMHFIGPDQLHGFEERLVPELYSSNLVTMPQWEGQDDDFATDAYEALKEAGPVARTVQMDYDEEVAHNAVRKIYDLARSDDTRSFFLTVSFTHPHEPFLCTQWHWNLYEGVDIPLPTVPRFDERDLDPYSKRTYQHYNLSQPDITDDDIRRARRAYFGSMSYVDELIGQVLDALELVGLDENTLVFFTSDHGEMLGERGMWFKKVHWQDSINVPLSVAGPGVAQGRLALNVSLVDLLPTFMDIADPGHHLEPVEPLAGHSLMPLITGKIEDWSDTVFVELTCEGVVEPVMAIKHGPFKYMYSNSDEPLLFNLDDDPNELVNLAERAEFAGVLARINAMGEAVWGDLGVLRAKIVHSQKSRLLVREALEKGEFFSWDESFHTNTGDRYLRPGKSYNAWNYSGVDRLRGKDPAG